MSEPSVIGEITNSPARYPAGKHQQLSRAKDVRQRPLTMASAEDENHDVENDASFVSRSGTLEQNSTSVEYDSKLFSTSSFVQAAGSKATSEPRLEAKTANKTRYIMPAQFGMATSVDESNGSDPSIGRHTAIDSPEKIAEAVNTAIGAIEPKVTFLEFAATNGNVSALRSVVGWESASKTAQRKTPLSAAAKMTRTPASAKRDDEIDKLKRTLTGQGHWKAQRTALETIAEMLRTDALDGDDLVRLAPVVRLHLLSSLSQIVLAACSCVEAACEFTSVSARIPKKDFRTFSRELVSPLCSLAGSLSTGCKASQDAGMRCLYNLYLANAELNLSHVLGAESMGGSKNVAARRTAANFVFNLIHAGDSVQSSPLRDDALAEAVVRFFMDQDAETRYIARRALREMMLFRPVNWIEDKVISALRGRCIDEQVPYLKQFALEYPDAGRLLGIDGARTTASAVKSSVRPFGDNTQDNRDADETAAEEPFYLSTPLRTPASIVSLATTATKLPFPSSIKPFPDRLDLDESQMGEMLLRAHYANRPRTSPAAFERLPHLEERSDTGEALLQAHMANEASITEEESHMGEALLNARRANKPLVEQEDSNVGEALLRAHYANRPGQTNLQDRHLAQFVSPLGSVESSPLGERLRARKIERQIRPPLNVHEEVDASAEAKPIPLNSSGWRRMVLVAFLGTMIGYVIAWGGLFAHEQRLNGSWIANNVYSVESPNQVSSLAVIRESPEVSHPDSIDKDSFEGNSVADKLELQVQIPSEVYENGFIPREDAALLFEDEPAVAEEDDYEYEQHDGDESIDEDEIDLELDVPTFEADFTPHDDRAEIFEEVNPAVDEASEILEVEAVKPITAQASEAVNVEVPEPPVAAESSESKLVEEAVEPSSESANKQASNQGSMTSSIGVLGALAFLVFFFRPGGWSSSDEENAEEMVDEGVEQPTLAQSRPRRRISPPKGRFQAIEVSETAELRPVVRSRRVVEPDLVSVQEVEGRGGVTLITPRKSSRRSGRSRSKSK